MRMCISTDHATVHTAPKIRREQSLHWKRQHQAECPKENAVNPVRFKVVANKQHGRLRNHYMIRMI